MDWFQIRYDLYRHVQARVQQRLGPDAPLLKKYARALEADLALRWKASTVDQLFSRIAQVNLIFLADFHALQQSQKTQLRILKKFASARPVLLLECVEARYQKHLQNFLQEKISEKEFLKNVHWVENWGFPWENYRPLLLWARENKVPVYGINLKEEKLAQISTRDRFAASEIKRLQKLHAGQKFFIIYGDLHLARRHLPKFFANTPHVRVLQNSERIYFAQLKKNRALRGRADSPQMVRLNASTYCVLNVPPWVKWQNYLMFLEQTYDVTLDDELDYTDHIVGYAQVLAKELGMSVDLSDLSVFTASDGAFWDKIENSCTPAERAWIARLIDEEAAFYLAGTQAGYLPRASVNHAAGLAMEYLLFKAADLNKNLLSPPEDFSRWIWINAWSYFGSKLINPRRKTDTLHDMKTRLTSEAGKLEREPLQLALSHKIFELGRASGRVPGARVLRPRKKVSYIIAAELLGGLMGEKIFEAYTRGKLSKGKIRDLLKTSMTAGEFLPRYFKFVQFLEEIPISFKSKEEKI